MAKRVQSNHTTDVAYGGEFNPNRSDDPVIAETRVTLKPGVNVVTNDQAAALAADENFQRHEKLGYLAVLPDDDAPEPYVDPAESPVAHDPETGLPLVPKTVTAPADLSEADAAFLVSYDAMTPEERDAMYPALEPHEKALIDARKVV